MLNINQTHHGHVMDLLKQLPDKSINCCVTSPPYWGLRDYGLEPQIWGGDENCEHEFYMKDEKREIRTGKGLAEWSDKNARGGGKKAGDVPILEYKHGFCQKCNAWQGSFGLEPTPELYVEHTVIIFREIKRALADHGTLWLNLGDSYCSTGGDRISSGNGPNTCIGPTADAAMPINGRYAAKVAMQKNGLKPKDLVGIPWMVAFALRADGWYLRSDIIWAKPNPMPESVTDRPTKSHEYIFMLTKSGNSIYWTHRDGRIVSKNPEPDHRWIHNDTKKEIDIEPIDIDNYRRINLWKGHDYFYDADAIREQSTGQNGSAANFKRETKDHVIPNQLKSQHRLDRNPTEDNGSRNKRSVWEVTTKPFSAAHFATFPPDLIAPCIKAGCPEQVCTKCGLPREKVFETAFTEHTGKTNSQYNEKTTAGRLAKLRQASRENGQEYVNNKKVIGYTNCGCNPKSPPFLKGESREATGGCSPLSNVLSNKYRPGIVLDPFMGAGTTAMVAQKLDRNYIGIELNEDYIKIADKRMYKELGMFIRQTA